MIVTRRLANVVTVETPTLLAAFTDPPQVHLEPLPYAVARRTWMCGGWHRWSAWTS